MFQNLPKLRTVEGAALHGKRIFVRVDWNEPVVDGKVVDDFRIMKTLPTLRFLLAHASQVVIATHLEDPAGSVEPLFETFLSYEGMREYREKIVMLPNLRANPGEVANDIAFARELAAYADMYVNEAFPVSHRAHASIVSLPILLPHYAGYLFEDEVWALEKVFTPKHPFVAVMGGAKLDTKIPLLEKLLELSDTVIVSGALCLDIFRARGISMGASAPGMSDLSLAEKIADNSKVQLPVDLLTFERVVKKPGELLATDRVLDVGPATVAEMARTAATAKMLVWNGPLGKYEDGFGSATDSFARELAKISIAPRADIFSIIGGGDTLTSLRKENLFDKFGFVSTAGGAMLDFIAKGTLPGIESLIK
jgi:phosphoglycerate kinase